MITVTDMAERPTPPARGNRWLRAAAALLFVAGAGWLAFVVSIAGFARTNNPALAAVYAPFDAVAAGERAYGLLEADGKANRAAARDRAAAALLRDPTAVAAARTLGFVADLEGNKVQARKAFNYAETLSRRDAATQLWLIEDAVRRNNVPDALRHYDVALRTSSLAKAVIEPVLMAATEDKTLVAPIAMMMRGAPWTPDFLTRLIAEGPSPRNTARIVALLGMPKGDYRRDVYRRLIIRAATAEDWPLVAQSYRIATGTTPGNAALPIVDPDFRKAGPFIPLDWQFPSSPEIFTERTENGLSVVARGDGAVARQLTLLPPGRYRIAITTDGALPLSAGLTCSHSGPSIARWKGRQIQEVLIEPGCQTHWLAIDVEGIDPPDEVSGTIILVAVSRVPRA
jgi:hypothetical protein